jgi:uncharacterized protein
MKLTDDTRAGINFIRTYASDEIRVGEQAVRHNCIVAADRILEWNAQSAAALSVNDVEPILALDPEIVILGTGPEQLFPDPKVLGAILSRGVGCEVMNTGAACRTYNVLVGEDRRVVAALLLGG